jgi:hypothetical protein
MQRPGGVTAVSIMLWIVGVLNVLAGFSVMNDLSRGFGLLQVAIGAAAIVCGAGCWQLKSWARMGTIGLMGLNALSIIVIWARYGDQIIVGRVLFPLIINVAVIVYLMQPQVKQAFER